MGFDNSIILATDSYKLTHWNQYPKGTEAVYSYFESRNGAKYPFTVFFGLQYIVERYLSGRRVTRHDISEAASLSKAHFGSDEYFNLAGWEHILKHHDGRLPLRIRAVPEGTAVPTGNVLMTVENTDPECYWLTNAVESLLTHVWYPSTVATLSREVRMMIESFLVDTSENADGLPFMLHDFGYRGASSHETAAIGGLGHLLSFSGTDTLPALLLAREYYNAGSDLGFSVAATEHSVMTSLGSSGEMQMLDDLLDKHPEGILATVADSYDIYNYVEEVCKRADRIKARNGVLVVRPDSITEEHQTPAALTSWIVTRLSQTFGSTRNGKGYYVLDPHIRVLWGDGIDPDGIYAILATLKDRGFSSENMVFGMGGGLLQKVNRDTQRFAFKCSAQKRDGEWHDVWKKPLDISKASKRGRLALLQFESGEYVTVTNGGAFGHEDVLEDAFVNGDLVREQSISQIREILHDTQPRRLTVR